MKCPVAWNPCPWPTLIVAVDGETAIDSNVLFTVTLKDLKVLLPALSVIVNDSFVMPWGKVEPLGSPRVNVTVSMPLRPSEARRSKFTTAPIDEVAFTVMFDRLAADGDVLSSLMISV